MDASMLAFRSHVLAASSQMDASSQAQHAISQKKCQHHHNQQYHNQPVTYKHMAPRAEEIWDNLVSTSNDEDIQEATQASSQIENHDIRVIVRCILILTTAYSNEVELNRENNHLHSEPKPMGIENTQMTVIVFLFFQLVRITVIKQTPSKGV